MSLSVKTLTAAVLALGGAVILHPEAASAQGYDLFRNGVRVTGPSVVPYRPAFRSGFGGAGYGWGGGYRPAYYGYGYRSPYYGGGYYRPAYYGSRYYGGYYPYGYYRRGYDGGGAVAAGLIGGLALGAIASAATSPYYYGGSYAPAQTCYTERRRVVNRYGRVGIQRIQTCY